MASLSTLVFFAPSAANNSGVFAAVSACVISDSVSTCGATTAGIGFGGGGISTFDFVSDPLAVGVVFTAVGIAFFAPAFAAASALACFIAALAAVSFLSRVSLFLGSAFFGSLMEMCLVSLAVRPMEACADF